MNRLVFLFLSLMLGCPLFANHWIANPHQFPTNMNVIGVIEINGIEQITESLELGAFYGEECRGSEMLHYYPTLDRYLVFFTLYGESGDVLTFRLYNHDTQQELDLESSQTISYSADAIIGGIHNPFVFAFTGGGNYVVTTLAMPEVGGTATGGGSFSMGESCTVFASSNSGYTFSAWKENDISVSTDSEYRFVVTSDRTLTAYFETTTYTIDVEVMPEAAGVVTGMGTYHENEICTLSATANEHCDFLNWSENGTVVSTESVYSFPVTANRFLTANFNMANSYEIAAEVVPADGGYIEGTGSFIEGDTCHLKAFPAAGYTFANWSENGEVVSTDSNYSFPVMGNRFLTAKFLINSYVITAESQPAEGGTITGFGEFDYGSIVTLRARPNSTYRFINWTENGELVSVQPNYTFQVTRDRHLVATFSESCYVIKTEADPEEGGSVEGAGNFIEGTTCRLEARPSNGYTFVDWFEDGEVVCAQPEYSFVVERDRHLVAHFKIEYYEVTAIADPASGGIVDGMGTFTYGQTVDLKAAPNENYVFLNWTEDGHVVSENYIYSFEVYGNRALVAHFVYFDAISDSEKNCAVYPNPTNGVVMIQGLPQSVVRVFDANGKLLLSETVSETHGLDLRTFPSGWYLLEIQSSEGLHCKKILKR